MALLILLFMCVIWNLSEGYDPFEGLLPGAPCFKSRTLTGCNGTLLSNFHPIARTASYNDPDTLVFLFTPRNRRNPEFLHKCGGTLPTNTYFDPRLETKILVHGYLDGVCRTAWMREMIDQLFIRGDYNVVLVDWTWGDTFDVASSIVNTRVVGQQLGFVLRNLITEGGARPESLHIIGVSFGSHVAGFAGKTVGNLGRITGLEPALPGFSNVSPEERLDRHDANLVDIVHSGGTACGEGIGLGAIYPWGDADFYINGGRPPQPACVPAALEAFLKLDVEFGALTILPFFCSHQQSINYYKVTINPGNCNYTGYECPSYESFQSGECERSCGEDGSRCAWMGLDFDKTFKKNGKHPRKFYLNTRILCPYCEETAEVSKE